MPASTEKDRSVARYVGTIVGESTSRDFGLALAREAVREQDIIAVDAELRRTDNPTRGKKTGLGEGPAIERVNPLFPHEAGHELAATQTHPLDTVVSLSREMVTAVCQVLARNRWKGRRRQASSTYVTRAARSSALPTKHRATSPALSSAIFSRGRSAPRHRHVEQSPEIRVKVDGHAVVTRHLGILAMTGAGRAGRPDG